jgi:hypothetical protein
MLSSKWTSKLVIGICAVAASSCSSNEETKHVKPLPPKQVQQPQPKEKIPYNLHPEADNTDSYAIPSDSTEAELNEEIKELNEEAAKHSRR